MGKTKIKTIDDSIQEEVKKEPQAKRGQKQDLLVEKLKAELEIEGKLDVRSEKLDEEVGILKLEQESKVQTSNLQPLNPSSNIQHQTSKFKPRSKKYQQALAQIDQSRTYPLKEAVGLVQKTSYTKFPGTVEAHINTITKNTKFFSGKVEVKCEPNGQVIHLGVGKISQSADEISSNIKALYNSLGKSKIKKITLSATMSPGVRVDLNSI